MIDFLRGKVALRESDYAVLDVNGVGYRVFCPNPYALSHKEDEDVTMFIHYHVREDAHLLFGFISRDEQSLFRLLLDVTGIGPKVALGILAAGGRPEAVILAISQENLAFLDEASRNRKEDSAAYYFGSEGQIGFCELLKPGSCGSFKRGWIGSVKRWRSCLERSEGSVDDAWLHGS